MGAAQANVAQQFDAARQNATRQLESYGINFLLMALLPVIVSHAIFGIVMGNVYGRLVARDKRLLRLDLVLPAASTRL